jgi:hypothetical protein
MLNIPLNFADIISVHLLLGIGVDFSLHVVHRAKENGQGPRHILETSTARGVLFSSLTTIMSFGSLSFMHHAGTARRYLPPIGDLKRVPLRRGIIKNPDLFPVYRGLW